MPNPTALVPRPHSRAAMINAPDPIITNRQCLDAVASLQKTVVVLGLRVLALEECESIVREILDEDGGGSVRTYGRCVRAVIALDEGKGMLSP